MRARMLALCMAASIGAFAIAAAEKAQAANILASENGDTAVLTGDANFDETPFTSTSSGETATGSGAFDANSTATGSALVVLTEGVGGLASDWLLLTYTGPGGFGTESIIATWNSDLDPGGLPPLPTGVTPIFLAETGAVQDVTALLTAAGNFPSNITIQVQSDAPEPVPEPASLALLAAGLIGFGVIHRRVQRRRRGGQT